MKLYQLWAVARHTIIISYKILRFHIQGGNVCALFTGAAYRLVKYFQPIPKEINQDTSTVYT